MVYSIDVNYIEFADKFRGSPCPPTQLTRGLEAKVSRRRLLQIKTKTNIIKAPPQFAFHIII